MLARARAYDDTTLSLDQVPAAVHRTPTFRPKIPKAWPLEVAAFLGTMWTANPAERPDFGQVVAHFTRWQQVAAAPVAEGAPLPELVIGLQPVRRGCCVLQ